MTLRLHDIAPVRDDAGWRTTRRHGRAVHAPYDRLRPTRREFITGVLTVGSAIGVSALGIFPPARPASAGHGSWKIWQGCAGLGDWVKDDDCRGCNQTRLCCCNVEGYHKAIGCHYKHRPDACRSGGYDGWTWKVGSCCLKSSTCSGDGCCECYRDMKWRCSDGGYRSNCDNPFVPSICRKRVAGGTSCGACGC